MTQNSLLFGLVHNTPKMIIFMKETLATICHKGQERFSIARARFSIARAHRLIERRWNALRSTMVAHN